jgi:hypothetical protein
LRIDIVSKNGAEDPGLWTFGEPKLVLAGERSSEADYSEPFAVKAQPSRNRFELPAPEYVIVGYFDRTGRHTVHRTEVLDADHCVSTYETLADGATDGNSDLWMECLESSDFYTDHAGGTWGSFNTWLDGVRQSNKRVDIYRHYVTGSLAGTSELVLEDGQSPDAGL